MTGQCYLQSHSSSSSAVEEKASLTEGVWSVTVARAVTPRQAPGVTCAQAFTSLPTAPHWGAGLAERGVEQSTR